MLKYKLETCCLYSSGGLGDIILDYLSKPQWLKILGVKEICDIEINVLLKTTNKFAADIFAYNPNISKIYFQDFSDDITKFVHPSLDAVIKDAKITEQRMPIYLGPDELLQFNSIKASGPYVIVHPFAGEDFREWINKVNFPEMVNSIIQRGYNVVVIGGSHFRDAKIENQRKFRDEKFSYERDGLFNLVGKGSVRLFLSLIENSYRFIGSSSCYLTSSWCFGGKSLAIIPSNNFLPRGNWWGDVIHEKSLTLPFSELHQINKILNAFL